MKKILLEILVLFIFSITPSFAYIEKIYNECGERIGSVRKTGEIITWYNNDGEEVKEYSDLFKPTKDDEKPKFIVGGYPRRYMNPFNKNKPLNCRKNIYYVPTGGYQFIPNEFFIGN